MTEEKVKLLLEQAYNTIFSNDFFVQSRVQYETLRLTLVDDKISADTKYYPVILKAVQSIKKTGIIESCTDQSIVAASGAGWTGSNPAIVELIFNEGTILIKGWAKEGKINQSTAKHVVHRFKRTIEKTIWAEMKK